MEQAKKIPIVVGVTGHRNLVDEDKPKIRELVRANLKKIQNMCKAKGKHGGETPVIMLNAFAQGADMLCAEVAFELGIDVYAVLPCRKERYIQSFDDEADREKLFDYLERTKRQIVAPDMEENRKWLVSNGYTDRDSYEYRQLGIYIAEHSHILLALWDGKPPRAQFGCGTAEVIGFALEHKYLDKEHLFKPSAINDSVVLQIKVRRQGDGSAPDIRSEWLTVDPAKQNALSGDPYARSADPFSGNEVDEHFKFVKDIIEQTVEYNAEKVKMSDDAVVLWEKTEQLDEYRMALRYHHAKADKASYDNNQVHYNRFMMILAILGTLVASTFLLYDDASLPFMIFPCTALILIVMLLTQIGKRRAVHRKYVRYRVLAEAFRIQFYSSMCLNEGEKNVMNVCNLQSWTQKMEMAWIYKAIQTLAILSHSRVLDVDTDQVIETWIGKNGQLSYHTRKLPKHRKKAAFYDKLSTVFQTAAIVFYGILFVLEVLGCVFKPLGIDWFWENNIVAHVTWRNFGAIVVGLFTAGSLLLSSYWGKLSYDRKADDNEKMQHFFASACERWSAVKACAPNETDKFIREIAREEIVENGIWCSYVSENRLEVNI